MRILDFISFNEGIDFEGNFTPLYHSTRSILAILNSDSLKVSMRGPARGPKGICLTRSKFFDDLGIHSSIGYGDYPRIILIREKLLKDGYRSYPLCELFLSKDAKKNRSSWVNKKSLSTPNISKSNFDIIGNRPKRGVHHNIKGIPNKKDCLLEVEYEERILKDVKNLGKYTYAINLMSEDDIIRYKVEISNYLKKYPDIKILIGRYNFKEIFL